MGKAPYSTSGYKLFGIIKYRNYFFINLYKNEEIVIFREVIVKSIIRN
jgi:hypothetical protein